MAMRQALSRWALFLLLTALASCSGIPLRSLPRLLALHEQLLQASPAELMLAIQVDTRMTPPPGAAPVLQLSIRPAQAGAFEPVDEHLPLRVTTASPDALGLPMPAADRGWLVYSLAPESQQELQRLQSHFRRVQAQSAGKGGGTLSVGISQEGMAVRNPALAGTRWETWFQTRRQDGFFEIWSGTVADLLKQAGHSTAANAPPTN